VPVSGTARRGVDNVERKAAWEKDHAGKGGKIRQDGREWAASLGGKTVPDDGRPLPVDLGQLMNRLDTWERKGRCPVHGPSGARGGYR
jgi:hypothetical protein